MEVLRNPFFCENCKTGNLSGAVVGDKNKFCNFSEILKIAEDRSRDRSVMGSLDMDEPFFRENHSFSGLFVLPRASEPDIEEGALDVVDLLVEDPPYGTAVQKVYKAAAPVERRRLVLLPFPGFLEDAQFYYWSKILLEVVQDFFGGD